MGLSKSATIHRTGGRWGRRTENTFGWRGVSVIAYLLDGYRRHHHLGQREEFDTADQDQHERFIDHENPNADAKQVFHVNLFVGRSQPVGGCGKWVNKKKPQGRMALGASLLGGHGREGLSARLMNTPLLHFPLYSVDMIHSQNSAWGRKKLALSLCTCELEIEVPCNGWAPKTEDRLELTSSFISWIAAEQLVVASPPARE